MNKELIEELRQAINAHTNTTSQQDEKVDGYQAILQLIKRPGEVSITGTQLLTEMKFMDSSPKHALPLVEALLATVADYHNSSESPGNINWENTTLFIDNSSQLRFVFPESFEDNKALIDPKKDPLAVGLMIYFIIAHLENSVRQQVGILCLSMKNNLNNISEYSRSEKENILNQLKEHADPTIQALAYCADALTNPDSNKRISVTEASIILQQHIQNKQLEEKINPTKLITSNIKNILKTDVFEHKKHSEKPKVKREKATFNNIENKNDHIATLNAHIKLAAKILGQCQPGRRNPSTLTLSLTKVLIHALGFTANTTLGDLYNTLESISKNSSFFATYLYNYGPHLRKINTTIGLNYDDEEEEKTNNPWLGKKLIDLCDSNNKNERFFVTKKLAPLFKEIATTCNNNQDLLPTFLTKNGVLDGPKQNRLESKRAVKGPRLFPSVGTPLPDIKEEPTQNSSSTLPRNK